MRDLPEEVVHITHGFIPLSLLLTRLAQVTHNSLQDKIAELAKLPLPAAAVNGSANLAAGGGPDDTSSETLRKKSNLANFAQEQHGRWLKALVITEWSRKSDMVSKLIDLKFHIDQQRILYDASLDNIVNVKRDLTFARMPSPDLKTALQVLATGKAPWMPDLNYLEPAPLTASEQLKWMNDLNTLLSLRLNIDDYEKIPYHFRQYEIGSGRVTFRVEGEFEVDLTIADEDFEKQFWFIDFRFAFEPAAASLPASLRTYLEACVNTILGQEGLTGCYRFLHEFVLTSKINELRRQAMELNKTSWNGTLSVEPLNRALAIQYWTARTASTGTQSWIMVAVNSGRKAKGQDDDDKATSFIVVKWYRDNKEVKDSAIELDLHSVSAESLLNDVVGRHVQYILTGIRDRLLAAPRFKKQGASTLMLDVSRSEAAASSMLKLAGCAGNVSLAMEAVSGAFAVKPPSKFTVQAKHQLNNGKNAIEDGANCLESVRCAILEDEIRRLGSSMGWSICKSPLSLEETRLMAKLRDWSRAICLQNDGWCAGWFVVVLLGLGGDEWWLIQAKREETGRALESKARLPFDKGPPNFSERFWNNLAILTTGLMTHAVDVRELRRRGIKSRTTKGGARSSPSPQVQLPSLELSLDALFPRMVDSEEDEKAPRSIKDRSDSSADEPERFTLMSQHCARTATTARQTWASEVVQLSFKGIQTASHKALTDDESKDKELVCVSEAMLRVRRPATLTALKDMTDMEVSYDSQRGEFSLRVKRSVGEPVVDALVAKVKAIDRFVSSFEAAATAGDAVKRQSMSLGRVTFCYGPAESSPTTKDESEDKSNVEVHQKPLLSSSSSSSSSWLVSLDLSGEQINMELERNNPHVRALDLLTNLVNSDGGIGALMGWLPMSLPVFTAMSELEARWRQVELRAEGRLFCVVKSMSWIEMSYFGPAPQSPPVSDVGGGCGGGEKHLVLELQARPRRGVVWWHVRRIGGDAGMTSSSSSLPQKQQQQRQQQQQQQTSAPDAIDTALRPIWTGAGTGWRGLMKSAAGRASDGVATLILAIDDAVRDVIVMGSKVAAGEKKKKPSREVVMLD